MRTMVLLLGVLAMVAGLFWAGQGAGLIMWPAESFMLADRRWLWIGGAVAVVGLILVVSSRRVR